MIGTCNRYLEGFEFSNHSGCDVSDILTIIWAISDHINGILDGLAVLNVCQNDS